MRFLIAHLFVRQSITLTWVTVKNDRNSLGLINSKTNLHNLKWLLLNLLEDFVMTEIGLRIFVIHFYQFSTT